MSGGLNDKILSKLKHNEWQSAIKIGVSNTRLMRMENPSNPIMLRVVKRPNGARCFEYKLAKRPHKE